MALLAIICVSQPCGAQSVVDSVRRLYSLWARTYATQDTAMARALLADDLFVTNGVGRISGKAQELAELTPRGDPQMSELGVTDVRVRCYAACCVVTGVAEWRAVFRGDTASGRQRYTATYVRGGPLGWQIAAVHVGPVADNAAPQTEPPN